MEPNSRPTWLRPQAAAHFRMLLHDGAYLVVLCALKAIALNFIPPDERDFTGFILQWSERVAWFCYGLVRVSAVVRDALEIVVAHWTRPDRE